MWGIISTQFANFQINNNLFIFSKSIDPREFLLLHCNNGFESNRPDIVIQYLAVKDIARVSNSYGNGLKLYMKYCHCFGNDSRINADMLADLVNSFTDQESNPYLCLTCDKHNNITEGGNQLACALYFGENTIRVRNTVTSIDQESWWVKLIDAGLNDDEIDFIRHESDSLVVSLINNSTREKINSTDLETLQRWLMKESKKIYDFYFYQSFPMLGIDGVRPTDIRIEQYGIRDILNANMDVLDIGCNIGFMDMEIATLVRSVTGIELNRDISRLSKNIARKLNIYNATFFNGDFKEWESMSRRKYDLIFSFANYRWIGLGPEEYAAKISSLIKHGGYVFFEGHDIMTFTDENKEYGRYISAFINIGFRSVKNEYIMDDGVTKRMWTLLQYN